MTRDSTWVGRGEARARRAAARGQARAFVAREAAALTLAGALVCCVGAVGMGQGRKAAGLAGSLANLRKIGETTGAYAADFDDHLWSFTWSVGNCPSQYEDLRNPASNSDAIAFQATDIARRRFDESIPALRDRLAAPWLSTLVLADYLDDPLPAEWAVSPGDAVRLGWQADPSNPPDLNEQGGDAWSWLFSSFGSSYMLMPAYFAPEEKLGDQAAISQSTGHHDLYNVPSGVLFGGRRVAEIASPSRKVHMAERASFFGPRPVYFLHREARVPVLMADGSAAPRTSADANHSFKPNNPDSPGSTLANYRPHPLYDPPTLSGASEDSNLETHYKWTRRGLRGIDFAGERAE
ncbi:MAG: hypothetical protein IT431_04170 [Phycisphaerales bacterium]|nr:hypothetical protein [Phycisphaerales bacterium]